MLQQQQKLEQEAAWERFQDSPSVVKFKGTEAGGELNHAVKGANPNNAGPLTTIPETQEDSGLTKKEKKPTLQEVRRSKAASAAIEKRQVDPRYTTSQPSSSKAVTLSSSTPRKEKAEKLKEVTWQTTPETILEGFQNQDMTPAWLKWESMADQVLTRGVQKSAEEILTSRDKAAEESQLNTSPGFSDESCPEDNGNTTAVRRSGRQRKHQGPRRYGDPIKHSVRLIWSKANITDLNKAALEAYHIKLARFKTDTNKPVESDLATSEGIYSGEILDAHHWILLERWMHLGAYHLNARLQTRKRSRLGDNDNKGKSYFKKSQGIQNRSQT